MPRGVWAWLLVGVCVGGLFAQGILAQDFNGIELHGFVTQGFLFSSANNYLTLKSSDGSLAWTEGAVSVIDSVSPSLRVGIQVHMYQLGELGGSHIQVDWASGDYRVNDHLGFRGGKVKTVLGLFNDSQDVDAISQWVLLPQSMHPTDNRSFLLSHLGGEVYGSARLGRHAGAVEYRSYAGQSDLDLNGGYVKSEEDFGLAFTSPPGGSVFGGDLRWVGPVAGLTVGAGAHSQAVDGSAPGGGQHVARFTTTTEYAQFERGRFYLAAEYRREPLTAVLTLGQLVLTLPYDRRSWYAMGSYRVTKRFTAGSYYSHYVNAAEDTALPENYSKDWVVSGRWDFNSNFYAKLEGHFLHGTGLGYYDGTNPGGLKTDSNMLAARVGFSF